MSAAARKVSPESYQDHSTATARGGGARSRVSDRSTPGKATAVRSKSTPGRGAPIRNRWHETPPRGVSARARRDGNDADWRGLVEHFGGEETSSVTLEEKEIEARRVARKKARLKHRPFRLTLFASGLVAAPLVLLALLLWMKSSALALSRQDASLQDKIEAARFELEGTRREIAAVNASPQVEQWARERGWRQATQQDFDDISKVVTSINNKQSRGNDTP